MANTISGEKAEAQNESASMEVSSQTSQPKDKRSTRKTAKLTLEQRAEILTQALSDYQEAGGIVGITTYEKSHKVTIEIYRATFENGLIVPIQSADISAQPEGQE